MRMAWLVMLAAVGVARGQWVLQESHSTASFRGVDYVGNGVAWVSGTRGTVLKTEDAGKTWTACAVPEGAENLDFRGVQAFDASTAIVMSSGPGEASRLYKTVDGCKTWKLVFRNPDEKGFFDALRRTGGKTLYLLGDSVAGKYPLFVTEDGGNTWLAAGEEGRESAEGDGAFAASNTSFFAVDPFLVFATGGNTNHKARVYRTFAHCAPRADKAKRSAVCTVMWTKTDVPMGTGGTATGIFSLTGTMRKAANGQTRPVLVAVGGAFEKPDAADGSAAYSLDGGETWQTPTAAPGGYRSAVAFDAANSAWITVGPNGTDVSFNDGKNWTALKPDANDVANADKNWNALSLPFVVGNKGRIGILRDSAISQAKSKRQ